MMTWNLFFHSVHIIERTRENVKGAQCVLAENHVHSTLRAAAACLFSAFDTLETCDLHSSWLIIERAEFSDSTVNVAAS